MRAERGTAACSAGSTLRGRAAQSSNLPAGGAEPAAPPPWSACRGGQRGAPNAAEPRRDSLDPDTPAQMGRGAGARTHPHSLRKLVVRDLPLRGGRQGGVVKSVASQVSWGLRSQPVSYRKKPLPRAPSPCLHEVVVGSAWPWPSASCEVGQGTRSRAASLPGSRMDTRRCPSARSPWQWQCAPPGAVGGGAAAAGPVPRALLGAAV